MGVFRAGGVQIQQAFGKEPQTLTPPITAKLFPMLMMLGASLPFDLYPGAAWAPRRRPRTLSTNGSGQPLLPGAPRLRDPGGPG